MRDHSGGGACCVLEWDTVFEEVSVCWCGRIFQAEERMLVV